MQKKRLLKLADFLETVPKKALDMTSWVAQLATKPEGRKPGYCGFAGCAMGWATHAKLFRGLKFKTFKRWGVQGEGDCPTYEGRDGFDAAVALFGVDLQEADYLFDNHSYQDFNPTPKQVARRIRKFVESDGKLHG